MAPMFPRGSRAAIKLAAAAALAFLSVTGGSALQQGAAWSFDDVPAGRPPPGFVFASSPTEQAGQWVVLRDGANALLAQTQRGRPGVHLAVVEGTSFADLTVSARVRFSEGPGSAGLAWHYRDADNYYFVALDLRAQDVRIYRVAGGNRTRLEDEDDLELDPGAWHLLKVEHRGMRMRVWIDGVPVADERDRALQEPGAVGFWTTGDAVTWFDDLRVEPVIESERDRRRR